jgi:hypothetical protein
VKFRSERRGEKNSEFTMRMFGAKDREDHTKMNLRRNDERYTE